VFRDADLGALMGISGTLTQRARSAVRSITSRWKGRPTRRISHCARVAAGDNPRM
jgi:hypothetical protein